MKIKNLKYILCFVFGVLFFLNSIVFSDLCSQHPNSGQGTRPLSNNASAGHCWSVETNQNSSGWYDNSNNVSLSQGANLFLKMINLPWITCNHENVAQIQTKMQQIGPACSVCIDGKAGKITRDTMASQSCHQLVCPAPLQVPRLNGNELSCDNENFEIKNVGVGGAYCCKEKEEPEITIEPEISLGTWDLDTMRGINVSFEIDGYEGNGSDIQIDNSKISVAGGLIDEPGPGCSYNDGCVSCDFNIYVQDNSATLNINEGVVKIGNNKSSSKTQPIAKEDPEPEPDPEPENPNCEKLPDQNGECNGYGPTYFFNDGCCVIDTGGSCNNPPENGQCSTGFRLQNDCCINESSCSNGYYDDNLTCHPCGTGEIPNSAGDKCICDSSTACCGIQLNTVVPFIGDCIEMNTDSSRGDTTSVTSVTAFPVLMQGLMKIVMSVIMVFSFIMVIVSGFMMTTGAFSSTNFDKGKTILKNVLISLILLGCSGLILTLINPSFFGG